MGGAGGALGGQGGMSGGTGGAGGMIQTGGMGGAAGVAGMIATGGTGGTAGGGAGGMGGMTGGMGGMTGGMGGMTGGMGGTSGSAPTGDLCERWNHAHLLDEPAWNGDAASCEPGTMSAEALAQAHELHSLYREMAGLEPVEMTDAGNALAQECALVMKANDQITHDPGTDWDCYTKDRADTAATSSVSSGGALSSVDGYMVDPGNSTTIGHRRWILSNMLESVGFGSTGDYSCQYQPAQRPPAGSPAWIAWPPAGQVPIQSFKSFFANMDQTGWSLQSDSIDLDGAQVTVTANGEDLPVTVTPLLPGYGSSSAIRFNPQGWSTAAGTTYSVSVSGVSMAIAYEVEVIDCP